MPHPALSPNNVAVVTGGASGIGLAAAKRFAGLGLRVCIADLGEDGFERRSALWRSRRRHGAVMAVACDVERRRRGERLRAAASASASAA